MSSLDSRWLWLGVLIGVGVRSAGADPEPPPSPDGPVANAGDEGRGGSRLEGRIGILEDDLGISADSGSGVGRLHEALLPPGERGEDTRRIAETPPPRGTGPPQGARPAASARWIQGYWDWDPERREFIWIAGIWRVPPPGQFWVDGRWKRDARGWYRVPGTWSDRPLVRVAWRHEGPPADHPEEERSPAPSPEHFYVPGRYVPDGEDVVWEPGFWAKNQPGWSWVPGSWAQQADGWSFREGHWQPVPDESQSAGAWAEARVAPAEADRPRPTLTGAEAALTDSRAPRGGEPGRRVATRSPVSPASDPAARSSSVRQNPGVAGSPHQDPDRSGVSAATTRVATLPPLPAPYLPVSGEAGSARRPGPPGSSLASGASRTPRVDVAVRPAGAIGVASPIPGGVGAWTAEGAQPAPALMPDPRRSGGWVVLSAPAPQPVGRSPELMTWADQLVGQSDAFLQSFAPTAHIVPRGRHFLADARDLRQAALNFRAAVARGADPVQLGYTFQQLDARWRSLAMRTEQVAPGRTGPNIQLIRGMGYLRDQIDGRLP